MSNVCVNVGGTGSGQWDKSLVRMGTGSINKSLKQFCYEEEQKSEVITDREDEV